MLVYVITLRFSSALGGFDNTELREFTKDKEVLSLRDHFFHHDDIPHLAFVVTYRLAGGVTGEERAMTTPPKTKQEDAWRKVLTDADMPMFNTLRDWRAKRCKKDGFPPYVICNNLQLATMAKNRPQSLADLAKIEGFGKAKVEKYGKDILHMIKISSNEAPINQTNKGETSNEKLAEEKPNQVDPSHG